MTRELAIIHARENIRANAICPGPLRTELLMKVLNTEEKRRRRLVHIPIGRFGEAVVQRPPGRGGAREQQPVDVRMRGQRRACLCAADEQAQHPFGQAGLVQRPLPCLVLLELFLGRALAGAGQDEYLWPKEAVGPVGGRRVC